MTCQSGSFVPGGSSRHIAIVTTCLSPNLHTIVVLTQSEVRVKGEEHHLIAMTAAQTQVYTLLYRHEGLVIWTYPSFAEAANRDTQQRINCMPRMDSSKLQGCGGGTWPIDLSPAYGYGYHPH